MSRGAAASALTKTARLVRARRIPARRLGAERLVVVGGRGADSFLAAAQSALARAVHGQSVEQANQGEKRVYLSVFGACDYEAAALRREPPVGIEENVHAGRVHEPDLAQIDDERTAAMLERRPQGLAQQGGGREIDLAADTQDGCLLIARSDRDQARRERPSRAFQGVAPGIRREWAI